MARYLSNSNLLSAIADSISLYVTRRGVSTASQGGVSSMVRGGVARRGGVIKNGEDKSIIQEGGEASWVPDPETGFYRPGNGAVEVDVADLRQTHLTHKSHRQ
ncbi:late embryogenesis abundant protein Lea5-like [Tasmannia lanceolata]|uniref:late embryogenesis abundant protein Lea5-like n=1 Tax=Tasmannia lanceolata TaxID=3420 RepID=UPI004062B10D